MSRYSADRFPHVGDGRVPVPGRSQAAPPKAFAREGKRAYHVHDCQRRDGDLAVAWQLSAETPSFRSVASPRPRLTNVYHPWAVKEPAPRQRAALLQLSHGAVTMKSTVAGLLAVTVILSGLLIAIGPWHQRADAAPLAIFDGSLTPGWQVTAFHSTVNQATIPSPGGAGHPIAWTPDTRWSALLLRATSPISLADYSSLTLSVQSAKADHWYGIAALTQDGRIAAAIKPLAGSGRQTTSNAWKQYAIRISSLAPRASMIGGIGLFAWSGRSEPAKPIVYLDRIELLGTAAASPIQAVTATDPPTRGLPAGSGSSPTASDPAPTSPSNPASTPASGQPSRTPSPAPASSTFDGQGIYESCAPDEGATCLNRLDRIASGGFKLVLNYDQLYGSASQQLAYLNRARVDGLKVIFGMNDPAFWDGTNLTSQYSELAATCGCGDNAGFTRYVVNLVKSQSGLWGYYIGDEVDPGSAVAVRSFASLVRQTDPAHPRLYVADGATDNTDSVLAPFASSAEVLGADMYPVGEDPTADLYQSIPGVGAATKDVQTIASQHGNGSAMVLQAFSWNEYPGDWGCSQYPATCSAFPTEAQMVQMRNLALQNGHLRMILWYSYFDILRSDNPTQHWHDLVTAVNAPFPSNTLTH